LGCFWRKATFSTPTPDFNSYFRVVRDPGTDHIAAVFGLSLEPRTGPMWKKLKAVLNTRCENAMILYSFPVAVRGGAEQVKWCR
jgi:hypothetical protein